MATKILIAITELPLGKKLSDLFERGASERCIDKMFPVEIRPLRARPVFPSNEQVDYLKGIGIDMPQPETYRIYIGSDVDKITERQGGVELPAKVLEDYDTFKEEILLRIRRIAGSPIDN